MRNAFAGSILVIATLLVACGKTAVVPIPLAPSWELSVDAVRDHFPAVPRDWMVYRDCYESGLVPEIHEISFVPRSFRSGRTSFISVRCLMNSEKEPGSALCRATREKEFLVRSQGRIIRIEGDPGDVNPTDWISRIDDEAERFGESPSALYEIVFRENEIEFGFGGCGCYAMITARTRPDDSQVVFELDPEWSICF